MSHDSKTHLRNIRIGYGKNLKNHDFIQLKEVCAYY